MAENKVIAILVDERKDRCSTRRYWGDGYSRSEDCSSLGVFIDGAAICHYSIECDFALIALETSTVLEV